MRVTEIQRAGRFLLVFSLLTIMSIAAPAAHASNPDSNSSGNAASIGRVQNQTRGVFFQKNGYSKVRSNCTILSHRTGSNGHTFPVAG